jgi:hypothetical protein
MSKHWLDNRTLMQEPRLALNSRHIAIAICSLFILGCAGEKQTTDSLYDIDSVIRNQISYFVNRGIEIQKKTVLNGVEKVTTVSPKDSMAWNEELAIFLELDIINRPINRKLYKVEELADRESNLRIKSFTATEELPVSFLKVYYYKTMDRIRKIEAEYNARNSLYESTRLLTMEFEDISGSATLTSYTVDGGQKMFLDDSVQYTIDAGIARKQTQGWQNGMEEKD